MKCEKADPKSLRITAQDGSGGVGVYLLRVGVAWSGEVLVGVGEA